MIPWPAIIVDVLPGCEFTCIAEKNAPHFRQLATQNFNSYSSSYNVKSYTNFGLTMNEQKIAIQKFQNKFVPGVHLKHSFFSLSLSLSWGSYFTNVNHTMWIIFMNETPMTQWLSLRMCHFLPTPYHLYQHIALLIIKHTMWMTLTQTSVMTASHLSGSLYGNPVVSELIMCHIGVVFPNS